MVNPFEDEDAHFLVLLNPEEQYSVWPRAVGVPIGWRIVSGPDSRTACLAYIEEKWTDMRPKSLRARTGDRAADTA